MTSLPRVSVVVPVKDGGEGIEALVRSLQSLDYPRDRIEVLVVDNRSTDGTPERVTALGAAVLRADALPSSYHARNVGWRAASGQSVRAGTRSASAPGVNAGSKLHCDGDAPGIERQRARTALVVGRSSPAVR